MPTEQPAPHEKPVEKPSEECCVSCRIKVLGIHLTKIGALGRLCRYCLGNLIKIWPKQWIPWSA